MNYGEYFLYFSAGAFWGVIFYANGKRLYHNRKIKKAKPKIDDLIAKLKEAATEAIKNAKQEQEDAKVSAQSPIFHINKIGEKAETHVLSWRHNGKMERVNIIIDPALDTAIEMDRDDFERMVKEGEGGKLEDILTSISGPLKSKMADRDTFVFSRKSVQQMMITGITPDDIVTKMLKAAGRMD